MLTTFQQHIKEITHEDMHAMMKYRGISESDYRTFKNKPMALASTDQEKEVKKIIETVLHLKNYKTMDGLQSYFTFIYEIYPAMKRLLANYICYNTKNKMSFVASVNSIFLPQFLTSILEEIALDSDFKPLFENRTDLVDIDLYGSLQTKMFQILDLEDKTIGSLIAQNTFNPVFYGETLISYIAEKHHA